MKNRLLEAELKESDLAAARRKIWQMLSQAAPEGKPDDPVIQ